MFYNAGLMSGQPWAQQQYLMKQMRQQDGDRMRDQLIGVNGKPHDYSQVPSTMDRVQDGLDVLGLFPVVGEVADGANMFISLARGDKTRAAWSAAAAVPILG